MMLAVSPHLLVDDVLAIARFCWLSLVSPIERHDLSVCLRSASAVSLLFMRSPLAPILDGLPMVARAVGFIRALR